METELKISREHLRETIYILQQAGLKKHEGIVLWFAHKNGRVCRCFEPLHRAKLDMFHIPRQGIEQILKICRVERVRLVAQVHSHPGEAFHSLADDRWAIPRQVGALSIVLPYFAAGVTEENFIDQAAVFTLSATNSWDQVNNTSVSDLIKVTA